MYLHYLVKIKNAHRARTTVELLHSRIHPTSSVAYKFAKFESVNLHMENIAREGV